MNQSQLTKRDAYKIIENGIFYYPATEHYGKPSANIQCDFCNKSNLKSCIGYQDYDLCLRCTDSIANARSTVDNITGSMQDLYSEPAYMPITKMKQSSVRPMISTNMMQDSVRPMISTNMMQDSVRPMISTNMMQDSVRPMMRMRQDSVTSRGKKYNDTATFMMQDSIRFNNSNDSDSSDDDNLILKRHTSVGPHNTWKKKG